MNKQVSIKNYSQKRARPAVVVVLLCLLALAITGSIDQRGPEVVPIAFAEEHKMKCYSDGFDRDGDGYAGIRPEDARTAYRLIKWDGRGRVNCPSGYVRFYGDCNDLDPNVNPGKGERSSNGKDDNCNGVVDEPTFRYAAEGNNNTIDGFRVTVHLNSRELVIQRESGTLYADLEVASLKDTANVSSRRKFQIKKAPIPTSSIGVDVAVNESATVYRARLRFFRKDPDGSFQSLGGWSSWYYTMTDGQQEKTQKRARMVLRGFREYSDSLNGLVGYRGTEDVDGTRYGADRNESYCTEFYVWVTKQWLPGVRGNETWDEMIDYFKDDRSYYSHAEISERAAPGDYLVIDTDEDGNKNHSGMFLAFDRSTGLVWTLEGNVGNKIGVRNRPLDSQIKGLGHLLRSQLR